METSQFLSSSIPKIVKNLTKIREKSNISLSDFHIQNLLVMGSNNLGIPYESNDEAAKSFIIVE